MSESVTKSKYRSEYHKVAYSNGRDNCVFNRFIICVDHSNCENCGWNPEVEVKRKEWLFGDSRKDEQDE